MKANCHLKDAKEVCDILNTLTCIWLICSTLLSRVVGDDDDMGQPVKRKYGRASKTVKR